MDTVSLKKGVSCSLIIFVGALMLLFLRAGRNLQPFFLNISQIYYLKAQDDELETNKLVDSQRWLNSAFTVVPANQTIRLAQMRLYLSNNKPEKVLHLVAPDSVPDSRNPMEGLWIGHALQRSGRTDEALNAWREAGVSSDYLIEKVRGSGDLSWFDLAKKLDYSSHTLFLIGRAYENLSLNSNSIEMYQQANELNEGWQNEYERFLSQYRMTLQLYTLRKDNYTSSQVKGAILETLDWANVIAPETLPVLYLRLGLLSREMNDYFLAEDSFRKLVELSPNDYFYYLLLAESVFLSKEDPQAALEYFAKALVMSNYDSSIVSRINQFALAQEETYGTFWLEELSNMLPTPIDFLTTQ